MRSCATGFPTKSRILPTAQNPQFCCQQPICMFLSASASGFDVFLVVSEWLGFARRFPDSTSKLGYILLWNCDSVSALDTTINKGIMYYRHYSRCQIRLYRYYSKKSSMLRWSRTLSMVVRRARTSQRSIMPVSGFQIGISIHLSAFEPTLGFSARFSKYGARE